MAFATAALNLHQSLGDWGQHLASSVGDQHHIFNSNAALARYINSGLDGNHHARLEPLCLAFAEAWRFVNLQAYSMPRRMREVAVQLGPAEHLASGLIHLGRRFSWNHLSDPR